MGHAHDAHDEHGEGYHVHAHITSHKVYAAILGILIVLTGLTVAAYRVRLGEWNLFVAILIAAIKSGIVMAWFMHLKYEKKFNILIFLGSFVFMTIFLGYTLNDVAHRGRQGTITGLRVDPMTGQHAPGTSPLLIEMGEFEPLPDLEGHAEHAEHEGHEGETAEEHAAHEEGEEAHEDGEAHDHEGDAQDEGAEEPEE